MMQKAIRADEDMAMQEVEAIQRLRTENETLRELLQISGQSVKKFRNTKGGILPLEEAGKKDSKKSDKVGNDLHLPVVKLFQQEQGNSKANSTEIIDLTKTENHDADQTEDAENVEKDEKQHYVSHMKIKAVSRVKGKESTSSIIAGFEENVKLQGQNIDKQKFISKVNMKPMRVKERIQSFESMEQMNTKEINAQSSVSSEELVAREKKELEQNSDENESVENGSKLGHFMGEEESSKRVKKSDDSDDDTVQGSVEGKNRRRIEGTAKVADQFMLEPVGNSTEVDQDMIERVNRSRRVKKSNDSNNNTVQGSVEDKNRGRVEGTTKVADQVTPESVSNSKESDKGIIERPNSREVAYLDVTVGQAGNSEVDNIVVEQFVDDAISRVNASENLPELICKTRQQHEVKFDQLFTDLEEVGKLKGNPSNHVRNDPFAASGDCLMFDASSESFVGNFVDAYDKFIDAACSLSDAKKEEEREYDPDVTFCNNGDVVAKDVNNVANGANSSASLESDDGYNEENGTGLDGSIEQAIENLDAFLESKVESIEICQLGDTCHDADTEENRTELDASLEPKVEPIQICPLGDTIDYDDDFQELWNKNEVSASYSSEGSSMGLRHLELKDEVGIGNTKEDNYERHQLLEDQNYLGHEMDDKYHAANIDDSHLFLGEKGLLISWENDKSQHLPSSSLTIKEDEGIHKPASVLESTEDVQSNISTGVADNAVVVNSLNVKRKKNSKTFAEGKLDAKPVTYSSQSLSRQCQAGVEGCIKTQSRSKGESHKKWDINEEEKFAIVDKNIKCRELSSTDHDNIESHTSSMKQRGIVEVYRDKSNAIIMRQGRLEGFVYTGRITSVSKEKLGGESNKNARQSSRLVSVNENSCTRKDKSKDEFNKIRNMSDGDMKGRKPPIIEDDAVRPFNVKPEKITEVHEASRKESLESFLCREGGTLASGVKGSDQHRINSKQKGSRRFSMCRDTIKGKQKDELHQKRRTNKQANIAERSLDAEDSVGRTIMNSMTPSSKETLNKDPEVSIFGNERYKHQSQMNACFSEENSTMNTLQRCAVKDPESIICGDYHKDLKSLPSPEEEKYCKPIEYRKNPKPSGNRRQVPETLAEVCSIRHLKEEKEYCSPAKYRKIPKLSGNRRLSVGANNTIRTRLQQKMPASLDDNEEECTPFEVLFDGGESIDVKNDDTQQEDSGETPTEKCNLDQLNDFDQLEYNRNRRLSGNRRLSTGASNTIRGRLKHTLQSSTDADGRKDSILWEGEADDVESYDMENSEFQRQVPETFTEVCSIRHLKEEEEYLNPVEYRKSSKPSGNRRLSVGASNTIRTRLQQKMQASLDDNEEECMPFEVLFDVGESIDVESDDTQQEDSGETPTEKCNLDQLNDFDQLEYNRNRRLSGNRRLSTGAGDTIRGRLKHMLQSSINSDQRKDSILWEVETDDGGSYDVENSEFQKQVPETLTEVCSIRHLKEQVSKESSDASHGDCLEGSVVAGKTTELDMIHEDAQNRLSLYETAIKDPDMVEGLAKDTGNSTSHAAEENYQLVFNRSRRLSGNRRLSTGAGNTIRGRLQRQARVSVDGDNEENFFIREEENDYSGSCDVGSCGTQQENSKVGHIEMCVSGANTDIDYMRQEANSKTVAQDQTELEWYSTIDDQFKYSRRASLSGNRRITVNVGNTIRNRLKEMLQDVRRRGQKLQQSVDGDDDDDYAFWETEDFCAITDDTQQRESPETIASEDGNGQKHLNGYDHTDGVSGQGKDEDELQYSRKTGLSGNKRLAMNVSNTIRNRLKQKLQGARDRLRQEIFNDDDNKNDYFVPETEDDDDARNNDWHQEGKEEIFIETYSRDKLNESCSKQGQLNELGYNEFLSEPIGTGGPDKSDKIYEEVTLAEMNESSQMIDCYNKDNQLNQQDKSDFQSETDAAVSHEKQQTQLEVVFQDEAEGVRGDVSMFSTETVSGQGKDEDELQCSRNTGLSGNRRLAMNVGTTIRNRLKQKLQTTRDRLKQKKNSSFDGDDNDDYVVSETEDDNVKSDYRQQKDNQKVFIDICSSDQLIEHGHSGFFKEPLHTGETTDFDVTKEEETQAERYDSRQIVESYNMDSQLYQQDSRSETEAAATDTKQQTKPEVATQCETEQLFTDVIESTLDQANYDDLTYSRAEQLSGSRRLSMTVGNTIRSRLNQKLQTGRDRLKQTLPSPLDDDDDGNDNDYVAWEMEDQDSRITLVQEENEKIFHSNGGSVQLNRYCNKPSQMNEHGYSDLLREHVGAGGTAEYDMLRGEVTPAGRYDSGQMTECYNMGSQLSHEDISYSQNEAGAAEVDIKKQRPPEMATHDEAEPEKDNVSSDVNESISHQEKINNELACNRRAQLSGNRRLAMTVSTTIQNRLKQKLQTARERLEQKKPSLFDDDDEYVAWDTEEDDAGRAYWQQEDNPVITQDETEPENDNVPSDITEIISLQERNHDELAFNRRAQLSGNRRLAMTVGTTIRNRLKQKLQTAKDRLEQKKPSLFDDDDDYVTWDTEEDDAGRVCGQQENNLVITQDEAEPENDNVPSGITESVSHQERDGNELACNRRAQLSGNRRLAMTVGTTVRNRLKQKLHTARDMLEQKKPSLFDDDDDYVEWDTEEDDVGRVSGQQEDNPVISTEIRSSNKLNGHSNKQSQLIECGYLEFPREPFSADETTESGMKNLQRPEGLALTEAAVANPEAPDTSSDANELSSSGKSLQEHDDQPEFSRNTRLSGNRRLALGIGNTIRNRLKDRLQSARNRMKETSQSFSVDSEDDNYITWEEGYDEVYPKANEDAPAKMSDGDLLNKVPCLQNEMNEWQTEESRTDEKRTKMPSLNGHLYNKFTAVELDSSAREDLFKLNWTQGKGWVVSDSSLNMETSPEDMEKKYIVELCPESTENQTRETVISQSTGSTTKFLNSKVDGSVQEAEDNLLKPGNLTAKLSGSQYFIKDLAAKRSNVGIVLPVTPNNISDGEYTEQNAKVEQLDSFIERISSELKKIALDELFECLECMEDFEEQDIQMEDDLYLYCEEFMSGLKQKLFDRLMKNNSSGCNPESIAELSGYGNISEKLEAVCFEEFVNNIRSFDPAVTNADDVSTNMVIVRRKELLVKVAQEVLNKCLENNNIASLEVENQSKQSSLPMKDLACEIDVVITPGVVEHSGSVLDSVSTVNSEVAERKDNKLEEIVRFPSVTSEITRQGCFEWETDSRLHSENDRNMVDTNGLQQSLKDGHADLNVRIGIYVEAIIRKASSIICNESLDSLKEHYYSFEVSASNADDITRRYTKSDHYCKSLDFGTVAEDKLKQSEGIEYSVYGDSKIEPDVVLETHRKGDTYSTKQSDSQEYYAESITETFHSNSVQECQIENTSSCQSSLRYSSGSECECSNGILPEMICREEYLEGTSRELDQSNEYPCEDLVGAGIEPNQFRKDFELLLEGISEETDQFHQNYQEYLENESRTQDQLNEQFEDCENYLEDTSREPDEFDVFEEYLEATSREPYEKCLQVAARKLSEFPEGAEEYVEGGNRKQNQLNEWFEACQEKISKEPHQVYEDFDDYVEDTNREPDEFDEVFEEYFEATSRKPHEEYLQVTVRKLIEFPEEPEEYVEGGNREQNQFQEDFEDYLQGRIREPNEFNEQYEETENIKCFPLLDENCSDSLETTDLIDNEFADIFADEDDIIADEEDEEISEDGIMSNGSEEIVEDTWNSSPVESGEIVKEGLLVLPTGVSAKAFRLPTAEEMEQNMMEEVDLGKMSSPRDKEPKIDERFGKKEKPYEGQTQTSSDLSSTKGVDDISVSKSVKANVSESSQTLKIFEAVHSTSKQLEDKPEKECKPDFVLHKNSLKSGRLETDKSTLKGESEESVMQETSTGTNRDNVNKEIDKTKEKSPQSEDKSSRNVENDELSSADISDALADLDAAIDFSDDHSDGE